MCAAMKRPPLNFSERSQLAASLSEGLSFKQIGRNMKRDCTTLSKEVRLNSVEVFVGSYNRKYNPCKYRSECDATFICNECLNKGRLCKSCKYMQCFHHCDNFVEEKCEKLEKPPYVCNGCQNVNKCSLKKVRYEPAKAQEQYETRLSESRKGIIIDEKEIERLNKLLYPLIVVQKQSIHHVYINHADEIMISEKTLYKIIDAGLLKVRNIDLTLKVQRKPRKKETRVKVDKKCREGRTFEDFKRYLQENGDNIAVVQIDSVEGEKGGKVLLTIHFPCCNMMLAFIREANDSKSVIDIFDNLYNNLGHENFVILFPVILTDNGSEFSNPSRIEFTKDGIQRTKVFYCDPAASYQKAECEKNHNFIRRISPKGKSMDHLNQDDIDKMMSHINSYARMSINNLTPIDLFKTMYTEEIFNKLNISKIHYDSINLSPSLLKKDDK